MEEKNETLKLRLKETDTFSYLSDVLSSTEIMNGILFDKPDSAEIINKMLIAAKEFYDAEWCGVIDTDIELGFWTPAVWYHEGTGFNGKTLFKTRECSDDFPSWIKAFRERKSIIIQGEKDIEENYPEEKEQYERLQTHHVIGVPYSRGSAGFFIVKNPRKHQNDDVFARFILFGLSQEIRELRRVKYLRKTIMYDNPECENEVLIKLFGGLEIHTLDGDIETWAVERKRIGKIITLLAVEPAHKLKTGTICDRLTENDGKCVEPSNIKDAIYLFRNRFNPAFSEDHFIKTTDDGYCLNPDLNIRTDLSRFEDLWAESKVTNNIDRKIIILKSMCGMYNSGFMPQYREYKWAADLREHYSLIYFEAIVELCGLLYKEHDYSDVVRYANEAFEIFPGNIKLYYWKIRSLFQNRLNTQAEREKKNAKKILDAEVYSILEDYLEKGMAIE